VLASIRGKRKKGPRCCVKKLKRRTGTGMISDEVGKSVYEQRKAKHMEQRKKVKGGQVFDRRGTSVCSLTKINKASAKGKIKESMPNALK